MYLDQVKVDLKCISTIDFLADGDVERDFFDTDQPNDMNL
jgi:hypothetical protein